MTMTRAEIEVLLDRLEDHVADHLESQHIDFKEWGGGGRREQLQRLIRAAVCMANGGGGTVVFGVADGVAGHATAIVGVPHHVSVSSLGRQVYNGTDPKLTPVFEEIEVPEGTRRLIAMHVHPGIPPYLERIGPDDHWTLSNRLRRRLGVADGAQEDRAVLRRRVIRAMRRCAEIGDPPLANLDVRRITGLDRHQVRRLVDELKAQGLVTVSGARRGARYVYVGPPGPSR